MGFFTLLSLSLVLTVGQCMEQFPMTPRSFWNVELSRHWDVLGPFPIHAREQQFLSPSFPLNLSDPVDLSRRWPSSYADGGSVGWSTTESDGGGQLKISFPNIRWKSLRATEGWAALQHHAVLRSSFTVHPPRLSNDAPALPPHLLVDLVQGSQFTVLPRAEARSSKANGPLVPRWYAGNIYAMERALPQVVELPTKPSLTGPTTYDIFVSGDYEIRLFGAPSNDLPVQTININVSIEETVSHVVREPTQDVICDFVDGHAFGDAIGLGFRSVADWWTVKSVVATGETAKVLSLNILRPTRLAPTQSRLIPVRIAQHAPFILAEITMVVTIMNKDKKVAAGVPVALTVRQLTRWTPTTFDVIHASYFFATSMPTIFSVIPPGNENPEDGPRPPILATHGAGVDIVAMPFWAEALPRNEHSWWVLPSGRTSWGLDWHGPSAQDAWHSVESLAEILQVVPDWQPWRIAKNSRVLIVGHSNGGQGAWYLSSRFPDRVVGVVPAAAFIKSQAYIPLTLSRSAHFIDPSLRAVLESSLTPDDNDLFVTNLAHIPILVLHGGDDDNVPVWHSRELVSTLKTWYADTNITYHEEPGAGHFYDNIFNNELVKTFINDVLANYQHPKSLKSFVLTVAIPADSGSLHGWKIEELVIPGRLARMTVEKNDNGDVTVTTTNVAGFSLDTNSFPIETIFIDKKRVPFPSDSELLRFEAVERKAWRATTKRDVLPQSFGRMQSLLASIGPLVLVVPHDDPRSHEMSVALRIAHDLNTYHKFDASIVTNIDIDVLNLGNIVVIGNGAASRVLEMDQFKETSPFVISGSQISIRGQDLPPVDCLGAGIMFLRSHPILVGGKIVFLQSTDDSKADGDDSGLEKVLRLFPIRTGITVPDWVIIGPLADVMGAAGVVGAGVWNNELEWNEPMSWIA